MRNENPQAQLAEFLSSVIEGYKTKHNISGAQAANLFEQWGVLDFLADGYELLHTQSLPYIIDEVEAYLANRGVSD